jgi:hypothetical protein
MLRRILAAVGFGAVAAGSTNADPPYAPYSETAANDIYNLLFCDSLSAFLPSAGRPTVPWQIVLSSDPPDIPALVTLADDSSQEGRTRYLAYMRLRAVGQAVPDKRLLGVIVAMPVAGGMDTLAAYSDGGVRYINHTSKLAVFEHIPSLQPYVQRLLAISEPVVAQLGPWTEPRRPPPKVGQVRITFLVSDGLYFGEGLMATMQRDVKGGPVIMKAGELLQAAVALALK